MPLFKIQDGVCFSVTVTVVSDVIAFTVVVVVVVVVIVVIVFVVSVVVVVANDRLEDPASCQRSCEESGPLQLII